MVMFRFLFFLLLLQLCNMLPAASKTELPPPLPRAVAIPFHLQRPDWSALQPLPGDFSLNRTTQPILPTQKTEIRLAWNEAVLWVNFRCYEEAMEQLITYHSGDAIWQNDCVEFFLDVSSERMNSLQVICSADGQFHVSPHGLQLASGEISLSTKAFADRWEAELTLPWSIFRCRPAMFRAALSRERRAGQTEYSTWNWPSGFNNLDCHGYFFAGDVVKILRDARQKLLSDEEYLQILSKYQPDAAQTWQNWLQEGVEITRSPFESHSPAVVKWLNQLYQLQKRYPRQDTVYNVKIAEILSQ